MSVKQPNQNMTGIWYAIAAYSLWGILPLYWKILKEVPAMEILGHRMVWSCIFVSIIVSFSRKWENVRKAIQLPRNRLIFLASSILISMNWFIYIWAVNSGHIVESSFGYYINPLLSVLLGIIFLKERLNFWQVIAILLALTGVIVVTIQYHRIPWVALLLAITFGLYGLVKKIAGTESITGLTIETLIISPLALIFLGWLQINGTGAFGHVSLLENLLMMGAGVVTATPLLWFAKAANRVPMSTLGFTQYFSPSISLLLGIFVYHESFTRVHLISFGLIWVALVIYSCSETKWLQQVQPKGFRTVNEI